MSDQAYKLRKLVFDSTPQIDTEAQLPPTIVVAGGKGGVGTTTVAINLAAELAQGGRRTVLVDAAPNADVAPMLGIDVDRGASLADVLSGTCAAAEALRSGPAGMMLLAGEWAAERTTARTNRTLDRLCDQLPALEGQADALVVDVGCGAQPWWPRFWSQAALVLLVTTPDDVAVVDAYATIKHALPDEDVDLRVLVNLCSDTASATDVQSRLMAACRRFLGRSIGRAPLLPRHSQSNDAGTNAPLAWETLATPFARNVHQLGRFAADVLSQHQGAARQAHELSTC
jgi:MinD-like ATPase involved in chromosome partitioning or flagellar assembly